MRTTIDVNDDLLRAIKAHATREHQTLKETFEQALRAYLARPAPAIGEATPIPVFRGQGVQQGVDLTENTALRAIMASEP